MAGSATFIITDAGERRKLERREMWSKRCADGRCCGSEKYDIPRALVPDDQAICDSCLLDIYGLLDHQKMFEGFSTMFPEDKVVEALRLARAGARR